MQSPPYKHAWAVASFTNMDTGKYSNYRPAGREHIPTYPRGFIALRIVQLVVALVILGLCAYSLTLISFSGNSLSLFTVSSNPNPASQRSIPSMGDLSDLRPSITPGCCNSDHHRLLHCRGVRPSQRLQLLGSPGPRHLRHRLLGRVLRPAGVSSSTLDGRIYHLRLLRV